MARASTIAPPSVASARGDRPHVLSPPEPERRPSSLLRRWLVGLVLAIVGAVTVSSVRIPAGPAGGTKFDGQISAPVAESSSGRRTFRVGIFNIHGGRGRDHIRDLARTASCLCELDIVGLNEVLGPKLWWQTDQTQQLGEILGLSWLYAPTESRWWDGSFGNGMLSALAGAQLAANSTSRAGAHTYRNIVLSTFELDGHSVHVVLTHLDSRDNARRQEQLRVAGELFLALDEPAILMGDLNTAPDDPQLARLLAMPGVIDAFAASAPRFPRTELTGSWRVVCRA